jgi:hypothetical protein
MTHRPDNKRDRYDIRNNDNEYEFTYSGGTAEKDLKKQTATFNNDNQTYSKYLNPSKQSTNFNAMLQSSIDMPKEPNPFENGLDR